MIPILGFPEGDMMALRAQAVGDSTLNELLPGEMTSGTGSGMPFLAPRTFAREIQGCNSIDVFFCSKNCLLSCFEFSDMSKLVVP